MKTLKLQKKLTQIEFMRAVCCILVMMIHITAAFWYTFQPSSLQFKTIIVLNTLSKFAVPSFVFISGFVLYYSYCDKKVELATFYKKRISKVVVPYLIWSILYIAVNYIAYEAPIDIGSLLYYFGLGKANYHLYYMCLILQFYIFFPLILKGYQFIKNRHVAALFFFIINFVFILYIKLPYSDRIFTYYIMFFVLGFYLADLKINAFQIKKGFAIGISALYMIFATYYVLDTYKVMAKVPLLSKGLYKHSWWYFSILSILFLYLFASMLDKRFHNIADHQLVNSISRHSFTIYLIHPMLMKALHSLSIYKNMLNTEPTLLFLIELFAVTIGSWIMSMFVDEGIKKGKHLLASKRIQ